MKSKLCFISIIGMLLLFAASANAQVTAGSFSVSALVGNAMWSYDDIIEDDLTYGAAIGYNFSENFGIEATYNTIDSKIVPEGVQHFESTAPPGAPPPPPGAPQEGEWVVDVPGGTEVSGEQFRIEGIFYIYAGKKIAPYASLGIGRLSYDYGDRAYEKTNIPLGFGLKYFVTDNIAIRADFRDVYKLPGNNILLTAGVTFQFGGK